MYWRLLLLPRLLGQFGARGKSTILQVGLGFSSQAIHEDYHVEALWCEAHLPKSQVDCGTQNDARLTFGHLVSGMVPATTDISELCKTLSLHGAMSISWQLVHGEKSHTYYSVTFTCNDCDKHHAVEAFLIKGGAFHTSSHVVEHHELNKRLVAVPIGSGNKKSSARFQEYIYYDKIVRVEPLQEDLDSYVENTDYSMDVARGDLLLAWKKWRGRIASENQ